MDAAGDPRSAILAAMSNEYWRADLSHLAIVREAAGFILVPIPADPLRLAASEPVPFSACDADRRLEAEVISIETALLHRRRGYPQLEDSLIVTLDGWEVRGGGRWHVARSAARCCA